ncbi:MAG: toxin-antitoxin system protein [Bacteroidaceae bacterium]|nr:toxin-antitoxin system protein [Bacteroidaceae bacterium]
MATAVVRKPVSFRLNAALLEELKRKAASANCSLNSYVEGVLLDDVYYEPNEETRAAIEEVKSGRNPNKVYRSVDEMFNDILNEE